MTGSDFFDKYQMLGNTEPVQSVEAEYAQLLRTAFYVVGPAKLYTALEEAEATGQQVDLTYPISLDQGPSDPDGITLISATF